MVVLREKLDGKFAGAQCGNKYPRTLGQALGRTNGHASLAQGYTKSAQIYVERLAALVCLETASRSLYPAAFLLPAFLCTRLSNQ